MNRPDTRIRRHRARALALLLAAALAAGCVYRPDIQQGNLLSVEDIDQVTVGMTRSQVRYLLGTPMVSDPFAPQRWDYVYRLQHGRSRDVDTAHFVVRFEGDAVVAVEKLDLPEPPRSVQAKKPTRQQKKSAMSADPASSQPRPTTPPPGDTPPSDGV